MFFTSGFRSIPTVFNWLRKDKGEQTLPAAEDDSDRSILGDIKRVGWSFICINDVPTPYQFSVGLFHDDYTNTGNYFKTVDPKHYEEYCGYARWLYRGSNFPMLQCVWPLKSGHYPWDPEYPAEGAQIQPLLTK